MPFSQDFHSNVHSWTAGYEFPITFIDPGGLIYSRLDLCVDLKKKKNWHLPHGQVEDPASTQWPFWNRRMTGPLPTSRKKSKQASSPCHSQRCPTFTGTGLQYLPFLSTLSLHPYPPTKQEEKLLIIWLTSTPIESGRYRVHPSLGPHTTLVQTRAVAL